MRIFKSGEKVEKFLPPKSYNTNQFLVISEFMISFFDVLPLSKSDA